MWSSIILVRPFPAALKLAKAFWVMTSVRDISNTRTEQAGVFYGLSRASVRLRMIKTPWFDDKNGVRATLVASTESMACCCCG